MPRIRNIIEVDGQAFVTYDNSGILPVSPGNPPVVVPPVVTPPVVTPPGTPALPAGAMRVQWSEAGQMTAVPGSLAVHVAVPGQAVGRVRAFILLGSSPAPVLPSGTLYSGVDPKTVDGGGTVEWNVRMGGPAGPGESQGYPGQDFILNVLQPGDQSCWFQFQWDPGYPPTAG